MANAKLDLVETTIGAAPTLKVFTGSPPSACAAADEGTMLVSIVLPSNWLTTASAGSVSLVGVWAGVIAATGVGGYFRIYDSGGTCHLQGIVDTSEADLNLSGVSFVAGRNFSITAFTLTEPV